MLRRIVIGFLIFIACIALIRTYTMQLPDYGMYKGWTVLFIDVPIHKNGQKISADIA